MDGQIEISNLIARNAGIFKLQGAPPLQCAPVVLVSYPARGSNFTRQFTFNRFRVQGWSLQLDLYPF